MQGPRIRPTRAFVAGVIALIVVGATLAAADPVSDVSSDTLGTATNFTLVGHDPLLNRGMNAAPAILGDYAYIGSRVDGTRPNAGVLVVNIADPAHPSVAGQIGAPHEAVAGSSSRELRIWPEQHLLIVMNFPCQFIGHMCTGSKIQATPATFDFFDISGTNASSPVYISTYKPSFNPHEFYLWVDPKAPSQRALLYVSTVDFPGVNDLIITDISNARTGSFTELATWWAHLPSAMHSMSVSADGTRAYLAHYSGGMLALDTSDFAAGAANPQVRLLTDPAATAHWTGPGPHSAVRIPRTSYVLTTDESYGTYFGISAPLGQPSYGCPWTWAHVLDVSNATAPKVVAEYKVPENDATMCDPANDRQQATTFSSHNPTVIDDLALISWYAGGLRAVDLADPAQPVEAGVFRPAPEAAVATEDPAATVGRSKVDMWSYPIIKNGLIYVVDIRNGLYVLRYTGPHADRVNRVAFFEGNSNAGDALAIGA